jgi:hypothetical protein
MAAFTLEISNRPKTEAFDPKGGFLTPKAALISELKPVKRFDYTVCCCSCSFSSRFLRLFDHKRPQHHLGLHRAADGRIQQLLQCHLKIKVHLNKEISYIFSSNLLCMLMTLL